MKYLIPIIGLFLMLNDDNEDLPARFILFLIFWQYGWLFITAMSIVAYNIKHITI